MKNKRSEAEITHAVQLVTDLLQDNPDAYIQMTLAYLSGSYTQQAADLTKSAWQGTAWKNIKEAAGAAWQGATWKNIVGAAGTVKKVAGAAWELNTINTLKTTNPVLLLKNEGFSNMVTLPKLWEAIAKQKQNIADFVVNNYMATKESSKEQTQRVKSLLSETLASIAKTVPKQKKLVQELMGHTSIILDPKELDDSKKIENIFGLLDKTIEFVKAAPKLQKALTSHNKVIENLIAPYIQDGISAEKIVNTITNSETLAALEKAYTQYRDSKHHTIGLLKAGATIIKNAELRNLITHVAGKFIKKGILNLVPNPIRRKHANKTVNDRLAKKENKNTSLAELCKPDLTELDSIIRHTLSGCFQGLRLTHNLDKLTIEDFNFKGTSLGSTDKEFSLAGSTISNTNFQNVKFKGTSIDLSGSTFDEKSFLSLLPSLKKAKNQSKGIEIKITEKIKIQGVSKNLKKKIEKAGLNLDQFEFVTKEKKTQEKETQDKNIQPKHRKKSFVQSLKKARIRSASKRRRAVD